MFNEIGEEMGKRPALAGRVLAEVELVRREIRAGQFQRSMAVIAAFSAVVSGFEAYIQHLRGAFAHWLMWTPVLLTPPTVIAAGAALFSERAARRLLPAVSLVSLADGIVGFVFHVRGIKRMPGGFSLGQYNVVMGPPIFAPLLMCTVGIAGVLAGMLRREQLDHGRVNGAQAAALLQALPTSGAPTGIGQRVAEDVAHGRFQQGMAIISALFAILAGGEAYVEHLRGSFNQRVMWTPVWVTPPMVAAAIGAALSERVARRVLPLVAAITFFDGLLGFGLHLRGIRRMPGGFANLQFNITMGPPLFAPLLFCAVGLFGLLTALLRRSSGPAD